MDQSEEFLGKPRDNHFPILKGLNHSWQSGLASQTLLRLTKRRTAHASASRHLPPPSPFLCSPPPQPSRHRAQRQPPPSLRLGL